MKLLPLNTVLESFFVQGAGSLEVKPVTLSSVPEIDHALEIANEAGLTCTELEAQHKRRDFIMLQRGSVKKALKDGYEKGREEERMLIAKRLKASGLSPIEIMKATGLSEDELLQID